MARSTRKPTPKAADATTELPAAPSAANDKADISVKSGAGVSGSDNTVAGQQGVAVRGNVGGDVITGTVIVKNYLRRTGLVDEWNTIAEADYLARVQLEFAQGLLKQIPPNTENIEALIAERYVPVALNRRINEANGQSNRSGEWEQLAIFPCLGLLIGDPYDGKSLLMRKIACELAKQAEADIAAKKAEVERYLPIYLPLNRYPFSSADPNELLKLAAFACGASPSAMQTYWYEQKRRVCLLIDNVDEIPRQNGECDRFVKALTTLLNSRGGAVGPAKHSIIVACRPENEAAALRTQLTNLFGGHNDYAEWSILPLTEDKIGKLLALYDVPAELGELIKADIAIRPDPTAAPSRYWRLVNKPGLIATLGRATQGSGMSNPPRSTVELCELFVRRLVDQDEETQRLSGGDKPFYAYAQVKRPVLERIAFRMLSTGQNNLFLDDEFCRELAQHLDKISQTFSRIRRYLPNDWHIADFLQALQQTPIANAEAAENGYFEFASTLYRDYFAALYLDRVSGDLDAAKRQALIDSILQTGRDRWEDALIFLSDLSERRETASKLMDSIFDGPEGSASAADLWLEKGNSQTSRIPAAVAREYYRQREFIEESELAVPPLAMSVARLARHHDPRVALQAVNMLTRFGLGAMMPLLDAVGYPNPFVSASAMHALLHLGPRIAKRTVETAPPLIDIDDTSLAFNNSGAGNATIGPCVLSEVPQTFRAEVQAQLLGLDFDPFTSECSFKLWHEPTAWFALDYFKQRQADWIGLAVACDTVKRVSALILQKALTRPDFNWLVDELDWCLNSYGRVSDRITRALKLNTGDGAIPDARLAWIWAQSDATYTDLRLLFDRINRSAQQSRKPQMMLAQAQLPEQPIILKEYCETCLSIDVVDVDAQRNDDDRASSLPDLRELAFTHSSSELLHSEFMGIQLGTLLPSVYPVAETLRLHGQIDIKQCIDSTVRGIAIHEAHGWNGIRSALSLKIQRLQNSRVEGIVVKATAAALAAA
ncbi:MAG: NACHT domain-containing protein [Anaerolineae bacterium]|nr:NACHT domain-containing protein [Anaerolineae bacterium]